MDNPESGIDRFFGRTIADPYRWLEDAESARTEAFIAAHNARSRTYFESLSGRRLLVTRLTELQNHPRYSLPIKRPGRIFYAYNSGLQPQSVWYQKTLEGASAVMDPLSLSPDGVASISGFHPSRRGDLVAYAVSWRGSDWQEIFVHDVTTGMPRRDHIRWVKFGSLSWAEDDSGFYYDRLPEPTTVDSQDQSRFSQVYFHRLGDDQAADTLIYQNADPDLAWSVRLTEDGRYLVLQGRRGTNAKNRLYYRDLTGDGGFRPLFAQEDARYQFIHNMGSLFFVLTDRNAPRRCLAVTDVTKPGSWSVIVPEQPSAVMDQVLYVKEKLLIAFSQDAHHFLVGYSRFGERQASVAIPDFSTVDGLSGQPDESEVFIKVSSFLQPTTIYRYDVDDETCAPYWPSSTPIDAHRFTVDQVFYPSLDGTAIPMFILKPKDLSLEGNHPTILYGYGGFGIGLTPTFNPLALAWLEQGGVYAIANLRGGDEYGETWHEAGMLHNKQTVFDDFHHAAAWLVDKGYTSARRLAIRGGSNGGLLVTAAMLQHPESYGAVVAQVPLTDMLRYHRFTVGRYWIGEYGSAEGSREEFETLLAYSPLHNIKAGVFYPPILVTTADTDDRVVPAHALKFVAALEQEATGHPGVLLRVDIGAGHGHGKPVAQLIEEQADILAFLGDKLHVFPSQSSTEEAGRWP